jgi:hypothetical protein
MELRILETITEIKSGNTYAVWKASGLKHYPTVLRILKKIKRKKLVKALDKKGVRGEKIYVSTLAAALLLHMVKKETKKLCEVISNHSNLFQELSSNVDKPEPWAVSVAGRIIADTFMGKESNDVNAVTRDEVKDSLGALVLELDDENTVKKLQKLSEVKWIRDFMINAVKNAILQNEKIVRELKKFAAEKLGVEL